MCLKDPFPSASDWLRFTFKAMGGGNRTCSAGMVPGRSLSHSLDPSSLLTVAPFHPHCLSLHGKKQKRHTGLASLGGTNTKECKGWVRRIWGPGSGLWQRGWRMGQSTNVIPVSPTSLLSNCLGHHRKYVLNCLKVKKESCLKMTWDGQKGDRGSEPMYTHRTHSYVLYMNGSAKIPEPLALHRQVKSYPPLCTGAHVHTRTPLPLVQALPFPGLTALQRVMLSTLETCLQL